MKKFLFLPVLLLLAFIDATQGQGTNPLRINCPANRTNWVCGVASTATVFYPAPTTTAGCPTNAIVTCSPPSGALFPIGTTTVTCRATNSCRESAVCTFTVTVARDTIPPEIQCPTNRIVWLCGTAASTAVVTWPTPVATDNADTSVAVTCSPPSGSLFPLGTTVVTCTATDNCTNRTSCTFTVTVARDTQPPTIDCPGDLNIITCAATGTVVNYPRPTAVDNADFNVEVNCSPASGSVFAVGNTTVTCTATDDCTNRTTCTFTVRVIRDSTPPTITCPTNRVILLCGTAATIPANFPPPVVSDTVDPNPTVVCVPASGSSFPPGTNTVVCTATDDCGNTRSCSFTITVLRDITPPVIECPSNMVFNCICPGNAIVLDFFKPTVTDDHDPNPAVVCVPPSLVSSPGVHTVVCTAADNCGNSNQCSFTVTFNYDTTPPVLTCPTNMTVWSCTNSAVVRYPVTATDSCTSSVTLVCTPPSGSVFPLGTSTVVCSATDNCTNRSTCTFTVTVRPPLFYNGLCHSTLGRATLNINGDDELEVGGLGASGEDGVRIELGGSQGLRWQMNLPGDPETDGRDWLIWQRVHGRTTAGTEIALSEMVFASVAGRLSLTPSAASYGLTLLRNGEVVYRDSGRSGAFNLPPCVPVWTDHCWEEGPQEFPNNPLLPHCMWLLDLSCDIETPAGPVLADAFVITPETPLPAFTALTAIEFVGRDVPLLSLRRHRLMKFGDPQQPPVPHRALGEARLVARNGELAVANLGTTGQDGVRIELEESAGLKWRMRKPTGNPEGDTEFAVFGRTSAGAEIPLRRILHEYRSGQHSVTPGAGPYEVKLLRQGQVVFQQGGQTGAFVIPPCQPVENEHCVGQPFEGWNPHLPYCITFLTIECDWETPNGSIRADTLVLTPEDPVPPIATVSAVRILGRNVHGLDSLTLLSEQVLRFGGTGAFRLTCPSDMTVQTCSTNPVPVRLPSPVVNGGTCSTAPFVTCVPTSGSLFQPGVTIVQCAATNACGEQATCSFRVTVIRDTAPPLIQCPTNIVVGTCSNLALVRFDVTATDDGDPNPTVVCVPPSGSLFPLGTTTVTCTATDRCTNTSVCTFTVRVKSDATPELENEPNDALASAHDLGHPQFAVVVGRIGVAGDTDYYRYTAPPNARAWITVDTGGQQWAGATSRNSAVALLNAGGAMLELDDNDGSGNGANSTLESGDASAIAGALLPGGTFFVRVSAAVAGDIIAPYRLHLNITTNNAGVEIEPNNTFVQANLVAGGAVPIGARLGALAVNEEDWFSFSIPGPSIVHLSLDGDPERDGVGTDVVLELFRKDGVSLLFSANSSAGGAAVAEGFPYRLSISGTYYVRVRGVSAGVTATYRLLIATCPGRPELPLSGGALGVNGLRLSWPAASESFALLATSDLRAWKEVPVVPVFDSDRLIADIPTGPPHQFFQLAPAGGWSNDTYHCCDANGQNCSEPVNPLTACDNLIWCHETEDSTVCEPQ